MRRHIGIKENGRRESTFCDENSKRQSKTKRGATCDLKSYKRSINTVKYASYCQNV